MFKLCASLTPPLPLMHSALTLLQPYDADSDEDGCSACDGAGIATRCVS